MARFWSSSCQTGLCQRRRQAEPALKAVEQGLTLRAAAARARVHVSTLCRWRKQDPALDEAFRSAQDAAREWLEPAPFVRPLVAWSGGCPVCGGPVELFKSRPPFWRCRQWPACRFSSWRPRAGCDCPVCGEPRYWSHTRLSVNCDGCRRPVPARRAA